MPEEQFLEQAAELLAGGLKSQLEVGRLEQVAQRVEGRPVALELVAPAPIGGAGESQPWARLGIEIELRSDSLVPDGWRQENQS